MKRLLSLLLLAVTAITIVLSMEHDPRHSIGGHPHSPTLLSPNKVHHHYGPIEPSNPEETTTLSSISSLLTTTTFYTVALIYTLISFSPLLLKAGLYLLGLLKKAWQYLSSLLASMNNKAGEKKKNDEDKKKKKEEEEQSQSQKKGGDDQDGACVCVCDATSIISQQPVAPNFVAGLDMSLKPATASESIVLPDPVTVSESDIVPQSTTVLPDPVTVSELNDAPQSTTVVSDSEPLPITTTVVSEPTDVFEPVTLPKTVQDEKPAELLSPIPTEDQITAFLNSLQKDSIKENDIVIVKPDLLVVSTKNETVVSQNNTSEYQAQESVFTYDQIPYQPYGFNTNETDRASMDASLILPTLLPRVMTRKTLNRIRITPSTSDTLQAATATASKPQYTLSRIQSDASTATKSTTSPLAPAPSRSFFSFQGAKDALMAAVTFAFVHGIHSAAPYGSTAL